MDGESSARSLDQLGPLVELPELRLKVVSLLGREHTINCVMIPKRSILTVRYSTVTYMLNAVSTIKKVLPLDSCPEDQ